MRTAYPSAIITKLLPTFTSHRRTALIPLDPIFAFRTLFELSSPYKINEFFIVWIKTVIYSIFSTSHANVVLTATFQAIMFFACWTTIVVKCLVVFEDSWAPCSGAPRKITYIPLYEFIEGKLLVFLAKLSINIVQYVAGLHLTIAAFHWTTYVDIIRLNLGLQKSIQTLRMEDMSAFEYAHRLGIDQS